MCILLLQNISVHQIKKKKLVNFTSEAWNLTLYAGNWEVIFGFLLPCLGLHSSWRTTRDLALPEEGHHEGLFGSGAPPTHQTYPACGQRAVCVGVGRWGWEDT